MSWPTDTHHIPVPRLQLVAFQRPFIPAGTTTNVYTTIKAEQMAVWLSDTQGFGYIPGGLGDKDWVINQCTSKLVQHYSYGTLPWYLVVDCTSHWSADQSPHIQTCKYVWKKGKIQLKTIQSWCLIQLGPSNVLWSTK